jgi:hypothetical protein
VELFVIPIALIALVLYVAWPVLKEVSEAEAVSRPTELEDATEAKETAISNLKDIEMDYRMGKLSLEDYNELKKDYEQRAVSALKTLESLDKKRRSRDRRS